MKTRKLTAIICLSLLGASLILRIFYGDKIWVFTIIILGIVMFIQSGNDSNWQIEKSIVKLFKRKNAKED